MKLENLLMPEYEVHIVSNKKEGYIKVKGSVAGLLNALSNLVENLKSNGVEDEDIDSAVNLGKMTDEELKGKVLEKLDNVITSDAIILDKCISWINLNAKIIEQINKDYPYIDFSSCNVFKDNVGFSMSTE